MKFHSTIRIRNRCRGSSTIHILTRSSPIERRTFLACKTAASSTKLEARLLLQEKSFSRIPISSLRAQPPQIQYDERPVGEHLCGLDLARNFETLAPAVVECLVNPLGKRLKVVWRLFKDVLLKNQMRHTEVVA